MSNKTDVVNVLDAPWKTGREDMQSFEFGSGEAFTNVYHGEIKDGVHLGTELPLVIARVYGEKNKALARRISATPDLLEACQKALAILTETGLVKTSSIREAVKLCKLAIAKAGA